MDNLLIDKMKQIAYSLFLAVIIAGCRPPVEFVGEEYPPTDHVELYCSWEDVPAGHRLIGHLVPGESDIGNIRKMRKKLLGVAKQVGADAMVIIGAGPCSEDTASDSPAGASTLRAHQIKVSLLRYRAAEEETPDTTSTGDNQPSSSD